MIVTVITVVVTHNLAFGVFLGILLSAILFAAKISKLHVQTGEIGNKQVYIIQGQLFFASVTEFVNAFDYKLSASTVDIDLSNAQVWDDSAVSAIDKVVIKYHQNGIKANIIGLDEQSNQLIDKVAVHNKPGGLEQVAGH